MPVHDELEQVFRDVFGNEDIVKFGDVVLFLHQQKPTGGSRGTTIDHIGMAAANLERQGFEVRDVEGWREHYRQTCKLWHDRLLANKDAAIKEVDEVKFRMWVAYLGGCAVGFDSATIGIFQTLAVKRERQGWIYPQLFLRARCPNGPLRRTAISDIFETRMRVAKLGVPSDAFPPTRVPRRCCSTRGGQRATPRRRCVTCHTDH